MLISDEWIALVQELEASPHQIAIGLRYAFPGLRDSPQMLHAAFMQIHRERCFARLPAPCFFDAEPNDESYVFRQNDPQHALCCKALAQDLNSLAYLHSYRSKYGIGTANYYQNSARPFAYHQWYSGRITSIRDGDTINGLQVGFLRLSSEPFFPDCQSSRANFHPRH